MRSIAAKISIYAGVVILAICVGFAILAYNNGSSAVLEEVEHALLMQTEEAARYVESRFELQLAVLEALASRPEIVSMDWEQQKAVLRAEETRLTQFLALAIVQPSGLTSYTDGSTADLGDRAYVIDGFIGKSAVSDLIISRVTNSVVMMYAVPIKNRGRVVGVLIGRRDGTALTDITNRLGYGESGYAFILH
ncbi:MAG: methyl-accepting chemotaxis protein, partial [Firmicutes bacterium]|nr:methyl-accepting chemotaxis protein [Bacillota bacterium]